MGTNIFFKISLVFLFLLFLSLACANVIRIPGDYIMVQEAIDHASDGDEVIVSPGVYKENIRFNGKSLILRSTDPSSPTVVSATILDGNRKDSVVTFSGDEPSTCVLSGFTITHGEAGTGAGIMGNGALATLKNNVITSNTAKMMMIGAYGVYGEGGGIARCNGIIEKNVITHNNCESYGGGLSYCEGVITGNTISDNSSYVGGGLYACKGTITRNTIRRNIARKRSPRGGGPGGGLAYCNGDISDNIISQNIAEGNGGGVFRGDGEITSNTITYNTAGGLGGGLSSFGGGIKNNVIKGNSAGSEGGGFYSCRGLIMNNLICQNSATKGGGGVNSEFLINNTITSNTATISGGGIYNSKGFLINSIIWGNSSGDGMEYDEITSPINCCIKNWEGTEHGNISDDPLFLDPENGDYRLQGTSPCIDKGTNLYLFVEGLFDLDGNCRIKGDTVDMGCYEYGSSPDQDRDLLEDIEEGIHGSDPEKADTDEDGLSDGMEVLIGTNPSVMDDPTTISVPGEYQTIQEAIFFAFPGSEIIVDPGTYYENLHFLGKNITLKSTNPQDKGIVEATIVDGGKLTSVITFMGIENSQCQALGLTICNGSAYYGGGINGFGSKPTLKYNCIIHNYGGGLSDCDGLIQNNTITSNTYESIFHYGGGLADCDGIVKDNFIAYNISSLSGGGLYSCNGEILNNTISYNEGVNDGGGIYGCHGIIKGNIIEHNTAYFGAGLSHCVGLVENNIIKYNIAHSGGGGIDFIIGDIINNTISGNIAVDGSGGGIYSCIGNVIGNTISDNRAEDGGGLYSGEGLIQDNTISNNHAEKEGGGIYDCRSGVKIFNNRIFGNSAGESGGALARCNCIIQNNLIYNNYAPHKKYTGGAMYDCGGLIQNNTITKNIGGGMYYCRGLIINCIVWENHADGAKEYYNCSDPRFCCIQDWASGGIDTISDNPLFVNPAENDFSLQSGSPCIDAGFPYYLIGGYIADIDGDARIYNGAVDMGSDEFGGALDSDGDLLCDDDEIANGCDSEKQDTDGDGLYDGLEILRGTNPTILDIPPGIIIPDDYPHAQAGLFYAFPGETVTLSPQPYQENIYLRGKNLILQGMDPLDDVTVTSTILDGGNILPVITLDGEEDETCIIRGLTITNGNSSWGGGIQGSFLFRLLENGGITGNYSHAVIENNRIVDNNGSGIYRTDGLIQNNFIGNNDASYGGGISGCDGDIINNIISGNNAGRYGGGIESCFGLVLNNTIWGNTAGEAGGGIYQCAFTSRIVNNIVWGNSAPEGSQIYDSVAPEYCCIQDWDGSGTGNISDDPRLADPANGDFHLSTLSPCIDAGATASLTSDFEGDLRPFDGIDIIRGDGSDMDMGADEFTGSRPDEVSPLIKNHILERHCLTPQQCLYIDLNKDGEIDISDLLRFLESAE